jgi:hypothetical protein
MTKTILIIANEPDIRHCWIAVLEDHADITHSLDEKESISSPNRFINKPINIPELLSSIKSLLDEGRDPSHVAT